MDPFGDILEKTKRKKKKVQKDDDLLYLLNPPAELLAIQENAQAPPPLPKPKEKIDYYGWMEKVKHDPKIHKALLSRIRHKTQYQELKDDKGNTVPWFSDFHPDKDTITYNLYKESLKPGDKVMTPIEYKRWLNEHSTWKEGPPIKKQKFEITDDDELVIEPPPKWSQSTYKRLPKNSTVVPYRYNKWMLENPKDDPLQGEKRELLEKKVDQWAKRKPGVRWRYLRDSGRLKPAWQAVRDSIKEQILGSKKVKNKFQLGLNSNQEWIKKAYRKRYALKKDEIIKRLDKKDDETFAADPHPELFHNLPPKMMNDLQPKLINLRNGQKVVLNVPQKRRRRKP